MLDRKLYDLIGSLPSSDWNLKHYELLPFISRNVDCVYTYLRTYTQDE